MLAWLLLVLLVALLVGGLGFVLSPWFLLLLIIAVVLAAGGWGYGHRHW